MWQGGDQIALCGWLPVCPYRGDTVLVVACKNRIRRSHPSTPVLSSHPPTHRDWHAFCLSRSRGLISALIVTSGQTLRHPSLPGFLFVHNRTKRKGQIFACSRSVWIEWRAIVVPWSWWRQSWKKSQTRLCYFSGYLLQLDTQVLFFLDFAAKICTWYGWMDNS